MGSSPWDKELMLCQRQAFTPIQQSGVSFTSMFMGHRELRKCANSALTCLELRPGQERKAREVSQDKWHYNWVLVFAEIVAGWRRVERHLRRRGPPQQAVEMPLCMGLAGNDELSNPKQSNLTLRGEHRKGCVTGIKTEAQLPGDGVSTSGWSIGTSFWKLGVWNRRWCGLMCLIDSLNRRLCGHRVDVGEAEDWDLGRGFLELSRSGAIET